MDAPDKVLEVRNLHVEFRRDGASTYAVKDVSFDVYRGRTLGIVGESGSGKSVSCLAVMGLLPKSAAVSGHAWMQNTPQPASHSDNLDKTENSEYSEYSEYCHSAGQPAERDQPLPAAYVGGGAALSGLLYGGMRGAGYRRRILYCQSE